MFTNELLSYFCLSLLPRTFAKFGIAIYQQIFCQLNGQLSVLKVKENQNRNIFEFFLATLFQTITVEILLPFTIIMRQSD